MEIWGEGSLQALGVGEGWRRYGRRAVVAGLSPIWRRMEAAIRHLAVAVETTSSSSSLPILERRSGGPVEAIEEFSEATAEAERAADTTTERWTSMP